MATSVDAIAAGVDLTFNTAIDATDAGRRPARSAGRHRRPCDVTPHEHVRAPCSRQRYAVSERAPSTSSAPTSRSARIVHVDAQAGRDDQGSVRQGEHDARRAERRRRHAGRLHDERRSAFNGIAPFDGQMNAKPSDKIQLKFNQYMDPIDARDDRVLADAGRRGRGRVATTPAVNVDRSTASYKPSTDVHVHAQERRDDRRLSGRRVRVRRLRSEVGDGRHVHQSTGDQIVHFTTAALALIEHDAGGQRHRDARRDAASSRST